MYRKYRKNIHIASGVPVNLARGKDTWQYSVVSNRASARAVDGNFNPAMGGDSCIQTASEWHAWWAVDLDHSFQIEKVVVQSRDASGKAQCVTVMSYRWFSARLQ